MKKSIWSYITYLTSYFTFSPNNHDDPQQSLLGPHDNPVVAVHNEVNVANVVAPAVSNVFSPPIGSVDPDLSAPTPRSWPGSNFKCEYPTMSGWDWCEKKDSRGCWLEYKGKKKDTNDYNIASARGNDPADKDDPENPINTNKFDIRTNYEKYVPIGIVRDYTLVVEDGQWNADGVMANDAKLINGTYPGPLLEACWGDTLRIKVINKLKHNGTAIHWHGIRQEGTMYSDGVPGITQCPIAPNDYFVYEFTIMQYGDSWYHSHYSVQYADGMLGPLTIHGPTSANWDYYEKPLLMTDWFHNSAFQVIHEKVPGYPTILLNGTGDITQHTFAHVMRDPDDPKKTITTHYQVAPDAPVPPMYQLVVHRNKKYILRLINTSFSTTFIFSIDQHMLMIVGADLVPIHATNKRTHVMIGIGQRFSVIVHTDQGETPDPRKLTNENFWIRTSIVKCFRETVIGIDKYDQVGILRYLPEDKDKHIDRQTPISEKWTDFADKTCGDEPKLVPVVKWDLAKAVPAEADPDLYKKITKGQDFAAAKPPSQDYKRPYPLGSWAFEQYKKANEESALDGEPEELELELEVPDPIKPTFNPMQIDYSDPFFLNLRKTRKQDWNPAWMVINAPYGKDDWVFMAITGDIDAKHRKSGGVKAAHPIHLHGHDFALLQIEHNKTFPPKKFRFNLKNPIRRDSVFLPADGWIVIAFKTDNPGSWIMHCHIAFHASEGLGIQINERQKDADAMWFNRATEGEFHPAITEAQRVCKRWKSFESDCTQHWPGRVKRKIQTQDGSEVEEHCWPACDTAKKDDLPYACHKLKSGDKEIHVFMDDSGV